jgi:hypothetical protein
MRICHYWICQWEWWRSRWCRPQSATQLLRLVGPLSSQWMMWWMSHQRAGPEDPGKAHPPSRRIAADRGGEGAGGACHVQWFTPGTQHYWDNPASRASRRVVSVLIGPPKAGWAVLIRPCSTGRLMVSTTWGRSPLSVGSCPSLSAGAARSMRASASGCAAVRRSIAVLVLGWGAAGGLRAWRRISVVSRLSYPVCS